MGIHLEGKSALAILNQAAPEALQAGRVFCFRVSGRHPGNGLSPACIMAGGQGVDDEIDLIDRLEGFGTVGIAQVFRGTVGEQPLMVGIGPFAGSRVNPVVVNPADYFLPV